ncbi:hypothetical protein AG1IA_00684 [Rhizoctonia solani AG-1 IA]|uniref:Uncharacterized protein n=1 Tax=Thanatephorus cucumeris (strain AG1-IA) TaxID=983506 RepID=L8X880_THACA|nr:hypothetical protein AG1IA_00684 [Rhizoctonia solani AG-1 IA]
MIVVLVVGHVGMVAWQVPREWIPARNPCSPPGAGFIPCESDRIAFSDVTGDLFNNKFIDAEGRVM